MNLPVFRRISWTAAGLAAGLMVFAAGGVQGQSGTQATKNRPSSFTKRDRSEPAESSASESASGVSAATGEKVARTPEPRAIDPFVQKATGWLAEAQHSDGGWGAGSHAKQQVRDPHAVQTDPATTAFVVMALLRAGHTPTSGDFRENVRRATEYLAKAVEEYSGDDPRITPIQGTQPQSKLGPFVDTAITAQFFARVLPTLSAGKLKDRVNAALDKCLGKLQASQKEDGSWNFSGWAPVLQSSLSTSALELAQAAGKPVDQRKLDNARKYQQGNVDAKTGKVKAGGMADAGVGLYSFSGSQRASASEARAAKELVDQGKRDGKLKDDDEVSAENLEKIGVSKQKAASLGRANKLNEAQIAQLNDEKLLAGFGSNGGEEFLSYMLTSESLVITGGEPWAKWNTRMHERLARIQSPDGSWAGHHCITSPVFCTAAVVQCLTADRDAAVLQKIAQAAASDAPAKSASRGAVAR